MKKRRITEDEADVIISERRIKEAGEGTPFEDYLKKHGYELVIIDGHSRIRQPDGTLMPRRKRRC